MESNVKGNGNTIIQMSGMSFKDTKELCTELIAHEISKYTDTAKKIAQEREEALTQKFLNLLEEKSVNDKKALEELKNPDMQYCFREAQISYMRYGTPELEDILSNILADRLIENNRTTLQIALNEAIKTAPLLLPEHLDILSMVFIFRYTVFLNIYTVDDFVNRIRPFVKYFVSSLENINAENINSLCSHIEYSKCGVNQISTFNLLEVFQNEYPMIFMKGFTKEEIEEQFKGATVPKIFIPHNENENLYQISAQSKKKLNLIISGYSENIKLKIDTMYNSHKLTTSEIERIIIQKIPEFSILLKIWDKSISSITLTSVGMLLGRMNLKKFSEMSFNMKIWIPI